MTTKNYNKIEPILRKYEIPLMITVVVCIAIFLYSLFYVKENAFFIIPLCISMSIGLFIVLMENIRHDYEDKRIKER